jgi:hypothetical protein
MTSGDQADSFAATYAAKTGDKVVVQPISEEEVKMMTSMVPHGEMLGKAMLDVYAHLDETAPGTTAYGTMKRQEDSAAADLGVKATSFAEWLEKSGWKA